MTSLTWPEAAFAVGIVVAGAYFVGFVGLCAALFLLVIYFMGRSYERD